MSKKEKNVKHVRVIAYRQRSRLGVVSEDKEEELKETR